MGSHEIVLQRQEFIARDSGGVGGGTWLLQTSLRRGGAGADLDPTLTSQGSGGERIVVVRLLQPGLWLTLTHFLRRNSRMDFFSSFF